MMSLFGIVEQMIDKAVRALCEMKVEMAVEVIARDPEVNQTEVEIEEEESGSEEDEEVAIAAPKRRTKKWKVSRMIYTVSKSDSE